MTRWFRLSTVLLLVVLPLLSCRGSRQESVIIGGGPAGGTFQGYAAALADVVMEVEPRRTWRVEPSAGSVANLGDIEQGKLDLALVYAGDAWLGRRGQLPGDGHSYLNVRALGRLYGAAAQMVVKDTTQIAQLSDLGHTRVAIGNPGSGTALAAQRYFSSLGLWKQIVPIHVGFSMALKELDRDSVEAVWLVVGYPNRALSAEAKKTPLHFLDLYSEARESGFFRDYPFYVEKTIAPNTYPGQHRRIWTFEDSTLLVARADLGADLVYRLLKRLYGREGRERLGRLNRIGAQLDRRLGLQGVKIPLHPGAERFWRELGMKP